MSRSKFSNMTNPVGGSSSNSATMLSTSVSYKIAKKFASGEREPDRFGSGGC